MADDLSPPFIYEGAEPVAGAEPSPGVAETVSRAAHKVSEAAHTVGDAIDRAKKPGMPLSILSNVAREAPLGSLLVAFLLGVAVARRR
ncbi:hypothetical protein BH11PSE4_BH11PSE4_16970 [soil metagenome]